MRKFSSEIKVGIFTLVSLMSFIYILYMVNLKVLDGTDKKSYYTITKNAEGVIKMTGVRINGVVIGQVQDVRLQGAQTHILFHVKDNIKIPNGSMMELRTRGLLGETFLEIILAADLGDYLTESSLIPMNNQVMDFSNIMSIVGDIAKDVKKITGSLSEITQTESGVNRINDFFSEIEKSVKSVRATLEINVKKINKVVDNLAEISQDVANLKIKDSFAKIDNLSDQFSDVMIKTDEFLNTSNEIAKKVSTGDGTLAKLINQDEIVSEVKKVTLDVQDLIKPATKLNINVRYHNEFKINTASSHYLSTLLSFRPERFYILGVSQYPKDTLNKTVITNKSSLGDSTTSEIITQTSINQPSIRFDAQFGHRFKNLSLRFGLFESFGGFGTDYHLFNDKFQISFDVFNFSSSTDSSIYLARFKLYSYFHFLKNFYINFGFANLTQIIQNTNEFVATEPFLGAGFGFNDDDLKRIIGIAAIGF